MPGVVYEDKSFNYTIKFLHAYFYTKISYRLFLKIRWNEMQLFVDLLTPLCEMLRAAVHNINVRCPGIPS